MPVSKLVLGMNARNFLYIAPYNSGTGKRLADDKLATKRRLLKHRIATPQLLAHFGNRRDIREFAWGGLGDEFVVKPAHGYGGEGILVVEDWDGLNGRTLDGETLELRGLESHLFDILEGSYSLQFIPDSAFIEERMHPHRFFKKVAPIGLPDIRIIVFNGVPVMAMLRLPLLASRGKANLHQGALGIGIDIRTGVTTYAILHNRPVRFIPGTKVKPHGLKIPSWERILALATETQRVMDLGYAGVDIVIDEKAGPLVLEVNARPGLAIQNANRTSLRTRLERVEGMDIASSERGVSIAQSLFAEPGYQKVVTTPKILGVVEPVLLKGEGKTMRIFARIDTGAARSSIDGRLADVLGFQKRNETVPVRSANGVQQRETVSIRFELGGKVLQAVATVTDRSHMTYPMIVGRGELKGFLVNPGLRHDDEHSEDAQ